MRGFGAMQTVFAYESQMDRVARTLGMDALALRRVNALRRGDTLPVGQVIETHVALPELCDKVWAALGPPTPPRAPHIKVGRGLACNFQPYGRIVWLHDWASAWIGFEMDGSLVVRCGCPDVGGGQASSLCQIASEVLGVTLTRISVHVSESALVGVPRSHLGVYHAPAGEPVDLATGSGKVFPDYTFGAHAAEVEVDTETGVVRVLGFAAAHDVGRAINPQSVEGQIQGGAVQGLGYGLMEEVIVEDGINLTTSFATYLIPTAADVPDVRAVVVESGEGLGPFNARGIGEPPIGPPAAAIANAIEDATGARLTRLPITAERVARALGLLGEAG